MIKRHLPAVLLAGLAAFLWTTPARAQDTVYTRDNREKGIKGKVESENTRGVKTSGAKAPIAAEDIVDITYEVNPLEIRLNFYRPAVDADQQAVKATKESVRKSAAEEALKKYEKVLAGLKAGQPMAKRNIEFRIAYLWALQAQDDAKDKAARDTAVAKLKDFKTKYPTGWQLGRALKTLAELEVEQEDYAGAEQTYRELAEANVEDSLKEDAELLAATVAVRAKKYAAAQKNLEELIGRLPKDSRQRQRAQIALAEALAANEKLPGRFAKAKAVLKKVIAETTEPDLKAMAYNTLGYCSFASDQFQDARWDFLWVDVVYNQDKAEHAKALYYLWQVFDRLNEPDRARDCLDTLLGDRQFTGTEFQRRALRDSNAKAGG
jgi:tetratricopeptide (TPR) repeat protein